MRQANLRNGPIVLVEPEINPVSARMGVPTFANYPPLWQARLAGQIRDDNVSVADLRNPGERRRFVNRIRSDPPAIVGISVTFTSNGDEAIRIASEVRRVAPHTVIIFGGTGPSEDPGSFWDADVDFICHRAGDASFPEFVQIVRCEGSVPEAPRGFFHRADGAWRLGAPAPSIPFSELRPYAWSLLPEFYWRSYFQVHSPTGMAQLSEGCPFDCNFCSVWKTHGRRVKLASLENVKHDFESLPPLVRMLFFADDIWMQGSEKQLRELHDPLLEWLASDFLPRRGDFTLTAETRTDLFLRQRERFREWVRKGHLASIFFGVEAVTDAGLEGFSKRNTVQNNSEAIRVAAEMGVRVIAQVVIPCDFVESDFDEIVRFHEAHKHWIRAMNFTVATPLPGTSLYADMLGIYPDLADRRVVTHPAFSLFTALVPTRLAPEEFYAQLARVNRVATPVGSYWKTGIRALPNYVRAPWLLPKLPRAAGLLRRLTRTETFLEVHRAVQGERLLTRAPVSSVNPTYLC